MRDDVFSILFGFGYSIGGILPIYFFSGNEDTAKVIGGVGGMFALFSGGIEGDYETFINGMIGGALLGLHMIING